MNKPISILLLLSLFISMVIVPAESSSVRDKIHPLLNEKLKSVGNEQVVEVFIRLKPLPESVKAIVKGDYRSSVFALKTWASYTQDALLKTIIDAKGTVINRFWIDNLILVRIPKSSIYKIANHPLVEKIFDNFEVRILDVVDKKKTMSVESWGIYRVRAPEAWSAGYTGEGVRIAVLDTGVDISHPALSGKMFTVDPTSPYYPGGWIEFDRYGNPVLSTPWDSGSHGTHCSGTALGGDMMNILIGVAPKATLMHALILHHGGGTWAQVVAGMQWAVDPFYIDPTTGERIYTGYPAHVVSMSWGAYGYYNEMLEPIKNMILANIVPVAAIGNGGEGTSSSPGNVWGSFGIGATDINDYVAWFSSGQVVNWPSPPSDWPFFDTYPAVYVKPDVSAPGVDIVSSVPGGGYEAWSGTSMATPHVAGTVALILQATGWLNFDVSELPETVYLILNSTSIDLGYPGQDTRYGWGRIDAYEAVRKAEQYAKKSGVEGYVRDSISREPVKWATVTVVETGKSFKVNIDGYFKIPLDPGVYTLLFEAWGYYSKTITVEVHLLNGTIAGHVYDYFTGEAIQGASIYVHELDTTVYTGPDGGFEVSVPPSSYTLTASAESYQPVTFKVEVDEAEVVYVSLALYPYVFSEIRGYVNDESTMLPIENAEVTACGLSGCYRTYTDSSGYYSLYILCGVYEVSANAPGYYAYTYYGVPIPPGETVLLNFSLTPLPRMVVVLGNTHFATRPHLAEVLSQLGYPVVEYKDLNVLLNDWMNGVVRPAVIVIDHWYLNPYSYPSWNDLRMLLQLALDNDVSLVLLGTSYSGYTAIHVLCMYQDQIEAMGIPAPDSYDYDYWGTNYIRVKMLEPTHPLFDGVVPDDTDWFYLGDIGIEGWTDYLVVWFTDDDALGIQRLANVIDDITGIEGIGAALWISPSGKPWFYLSSWAESVWMQYLEPGWDGMYSVNTMRVLLNAVKIGFTGTLSTSRLTYTAEEIGELLYTQLEVYLDRLPHGYVTGKVVGSNGVVLAGAKILVLDTPVVIETDNEGKFTTWLPTGTYQALISYPGYFDELIEFTITEGETTDLGTIVLIKRPWVAVYFDNNGEIVRLLESYGYYAERYLDLVELTNDVATGLYDLVIYAGTYGTPYPDYDTFASFLNTVENLKIPVIWLDNWGSFGYGIKVLSLYTGDPSGVGYTFGTPMYIRIDKAHPITRGYEVGDVVLITTDPWSDFSWFYGFSGETIATQYAGFIEWGGSIGWKITRSGAKWVLMSGFAPTPWTPMYFWTYDAFIIFYNAVFWSITKPLNVTISEPYLHVGDQLVVEISGAPQYAELQVFLDGELLDYTYADENGYARYVTKVPLIPGGTHYIDVTTVDTLYWGHAVFYVLPKIDVYPSEVIVPGVVRVEITGLNPYELFLLYLNDNIITIQVTNDSGAYTGLIIIPSIPSDTYVLRVVNTNFNEVASTTITVKNNVEETVQQLVETINEMNTTLTNIVNWLNSNVSLFTSIVDLIRGNITTLNAKLNTLNATLVAVIDSFEGRFALLNTSLGLVTVRIDELNTTLNGFINITNTRISGLNTTVNSIKSDLNGLSTKVDELMRKVDELSDKVKNVDKNANNAIGLSGTSIGLATVALLAGIVLGFRKH